MQRDNNGDLQCDERKNMILLLLFRQYRACECCIALDNWMYNSKSSRKLGEEENSLRCPQRQGQWDGKRAFGRLYFMQIAIGLRWTGRLAIVNGQAKGPV